MPRFWFSGPRILGGMIRPGISFSLSELRRRERRKPGYSPAPAPSPAPELAENLRNADEHPARLPLRTKVAVFLIWAFAVYGFIALVACVVGGAHADDGDPLRIPGGFERRAWAPVPLRSQWVVYER